MRQQAEGWEERKSGKLPQCKPNGFKRKRKRGTTVNSMGIERGRE